MAGQNGGMSPLELDLELEPALGHLSTRSDGQTTTTAAAVPRHPVEILQSLWAFLVAYAFYYKHVTISLIVVVFIVVTVLLLDALVAHATSSSRVPTIHHDYSDLSSVFDFKMAQIDHWCLQGDDDSCRCDDPTEPIGRQEMKGWAKAHQHNVELIQSYMNTSNKDDLDVVFLGDETTEEWNGLWLGRPYSDAKAIAKLWNKTFSKNGGGEVEGLALGIADDKTPNLLWRVMHGEMPATLNPKVWWILIGASDLEIGQCSEEAVLLGILRLAEEIHAQKADAVVVINSILPRLPLPDHKKRANNPLNIWPSIRLVNEELRKFCEKHPHFVFFDATPLFFEKAPEIKKKKRGKGSSNGDTEQVSPLGSFVTPLMPDRHHLSLQGHKVWGEAIVKELKKIIPSPGREN